MSMPRSLLLVVLSLASSAQAGPYAEQLARESDALMAAAVKRPYGWAWDAVAPANPNARATPRPVLLDPGQSPAAALALLWAGEFLNEQRYIDGAIEAARGLTDAQSDAGQIPAHAMFNAAGAGGRDPASPAPSTAATRAGLALLLAVLERSPPHPEPLQRSAVKATHWLMKQTTEDGGWPQAMAQEDSTHARRFIRLDSPDARDCTFALLLAGARLNDAPAKLASQKAMKKLLSLRLRERADAPQILPPLHGDALALWSTAYALSGSLEEAPPSFPPAVDVVASRFAVQALLGGYLMTGDKPLGVAMDDAAQALRALRDEKGQWRRTYRLASTTGPSTSPSTEPTTEPTPGQSLFKPDAPEAPGFAAGRFDLEPTLKAVADLKVLGRARYVQMLERHMTVEHSLAATVVGLTDAPCTLGLPVSRDEVADYLAAHAADKALVEGPVPEELTARVRRVWLLLIQARVERLSEGG